MLSVTAQKKSVRLACKLYINKNINNIQILLCRGPRAWLNTLTHITTLYEMCFQFSVLHITRIQHIDKKFSKGNISSSFRNFEKPLLSGRLLYARKVCSKFQVRSSSSFGSTLIIDHSVYSFIYYIIEDIYIL